MRDGGGHSGECEMSLSSKLTQCVFVRELELFDLAVGNLHGGVTVSRVVPYCNRKHLSRAEMPPTVTHKEGGQKQLQVWSWNIRKLHTDRSYFIYCHPFSYGNCVRKPTVNSGFCLFLVAFPPGLAP